MRVSSARGLPVILDRIVADKIEELEGTKARLPLGELKAMLKDTRPVRHFRDALVKPGRVSIIAEVKKASPSKGLIRADFDPVTIARTYENYGASAISVLTEKSYFQGSLGYLADISRSVSRPVLRKDFIVDEYQVYEARANGADAVLLIACILDKDRLAGLLALAGGLGLQVLTEVHDSDDLGKALDVPAEIVGINNRDLRTFKVDIQTTGRLIRDIPQGKVVVSESGISTVEDMRYLKEVGAHAALIGEALMREEDYGRKLRELAG